MVGSKLERLYCISDCSICN